MRRSYHILNGDSLKERFPKNIEGEIIVTRECLVEGNVEGNSLEDFFNTRAEFIGNNYDGLGKQDYFENTVPEFQKILAIPDNVDINLWFEDDLFCQVNFWFVINLIHKSHRNHRIFLIRPPEHSPYSFGNLNNAEIISIFKNRLKLTALDKLANLWGLYQMNDTERLMELSRQLKSVYPFICTAVEAHIERIPTNESPGRPVQSLIRIMNELDTVEFEPIFRAFCKQEAQYGFGDLQVKRLLEEINNNRQSNGNQEI